MDKTVDVRSVSKILCTHNVCPRCCLRLAGIWTASMYSDLSDVKKLFADCNDSENGIKHNESTEKDNVCPEPKKHMPSNCSACLGLLQTNCSHFVENVKSKVDNDDFKFSQFALWITIPVSIDLRQHLFYIFLKEKLETSYTLDATDVPSVKDVLKWILCPNLENCLKAQFEPEANFRISVLFSYEGFVQDCTKLLTACPEAFSNRRKKWVTLEQIYSRTAVLKAIEILKEKIKNIYDVPPSSPDHACVYEKTLCSHLSLYIGGRYNKYSRDLSQTPWFVQGVRKKETSVSELITDVVKQTIKADDMVFSSSGREDVDVLMLGNGRPFVLEIVNPRQYQLPESDIQTIEKKINSSSNDIAIRNLQVISKAQIQQLKEGEEQKRKTYSATCIVKRNLTADDLQLLKNVKDLTLKQKTPIRVLHRRPLATRERIIHKIDGQITNSHQIKLEIETQAGTYVKEFIHGDFGRTTPNLGSLLGTEADITELDVVSIDLDWPPNTTD